MLLLVSTDRRPGGKSQVAEWTLDSSILLQPQPRATTRHYQQHMLIKIQLAEQLLYRYHQIPARQAVLCIKYSIRSAREQNNFMTFHSKIDIKIIQWAVVSRMLTHT